MAMLRLIAQVSGEGVTMARSLGVVGVTAGGGGGVAIFGGEKFDVGTSKNVDTTEIDVVLCWGGWAKVTLSVDGRMWTLFLLGVEVNGNKDWAGLGQAVAARMLKTWAAGGCGWGWWETSGMLYVMEVAP